MATASMHCLNFLPQSYTSFLTYLPFFLSVSSFCLFLHSFFCFYSLIGLCYVSLDRPIHHSTILRDKPSGSQGWIDRVRREGKEGLPLVNVLSLALSFMSAEQEKGRNVEVLVRLLVQQAASEAASGSHIQSDICYM